MSDLFNYLLQNYRFSTSANASDDLNQIHVIKFPNGIHILFAFDQPA